MTVPIEELFDANIAQFDRAGELTGGILFAAKQAGVKMPGRLLADMVKDNPVNRIKVRELGVPQQLVDKAENTLRTSVSRVADMERSLEKVINVNPAATRAEKIAALQDEGLAVNSMKTDLKELRNEMRALNSAVRDGNREAVSDANSNIAALFKSLKARLPNDKKLQSIKCKVRLMTWLHKLKMLILLNILVKKDIHILEDKTIEKQFLF